MVEGSKGQLVAHPLLREVRMNRALIMANARAIEIAPPKQRTAHLDKRGRDQLRDARAAVAVNRSADLRESHPAGIFLKAAGWRVRTSTNPMPARPWQPTGSCQSSQSSPYPLPASQ